MRTGIYAGTFDPITIGHADIAHRAMHLFDRFILAVAGDSKKSTLFSMEERMDLIRRTVDPRIEVVSFDGLLIHFAEKFEQPTLVRGLRALADFEYEFQMALVNKKQNPMVETLFLVTRLENSFISSSIVKELGRLGGKLEGIAPEVVITALQEKFRES